MHHNRQLGREWVEVYVGGMRRLSAPVALNENQRVKITIDGSDNHVGLDTELMERARAEVAAMVELPTIEEVRVLLSTIPGSVSETVIAERGAY